MASVIQSYFHDRGYEHADTWADDLHKRIGDILEESDYQVILPPVLKRLVRAAEMAELTWGEKAKLKPGDLEGHR